MNFMIIAALINVLAFANHEPCKNDFLLKFSLVATLFSSVNIQFFFVDVNLKLLDTSKPTSFLARISPRTIKKRWNWDTGN